MSPVEEREAERRNEEYYNRRHEHRSEMWPFLVLLFWIFVCAVLMGWAIHESGLARWLVAWLEVVRWNVS